MSPMPSSAKVLAIDGTDLGARVNLAQLPMQKREYDRALELLRPAVAAEPYHVTALYNLGVALTRAGKAEEGQQVDRPVPGAARGGLRHGVLEQLSRTGTLRRSGRVDRRRGGAGRCSERRP